MSNPLVEIQCASCNSKYNFALPNSVVQNPTKPMSFKCSVCGHRFSIQPDTLLEQPKVASEFIRVKGEQGLAVFRSLQEVQDAITDGIYQNTDTISIFGSAWSIMGDQDTLRFASSQEPEHVDVESQRYDEQDSEQEFSEIDPFSEMDSMSDVSVGSTKNEPVVPDMDDWTISEEVPDNMTSTTSVSAEHPSVTTTSSVDTVEDDDWSIDDIIEENMDTAHMDTSADDAPSTVFSDVDDWSMESWDVGDSTEDDAQKTVEPTVDADMWSDFAIDMIAEEEQTDAKMSSLMGEEADTVANNAVQEADLDDWALDTGNDDWDIEEDVSESGASVSPNVSSQDTAVKSGTTIDVDDDFATMVWSEFDSDDNSAEALPKQVSSTKSRVVPQELIEDSVAQKPVEFDIFVPEDDSQDVESVIEEPELIEHIEEFEDDDEQEFVVDETAIEEISSEDNGERKKQQLSFSNYVPKIPKSQRKDINPLWVISGIALFSLLVLIYVTWTPEELEEEFYGMETNSDKLIEGDGDFEGLQQNTDLEEQTEEQNGIAEGGDGIEIPENFPIILPASQEETLNIPPDATVDEISRLGWIAYNKDNLRVAEKLFGKALQKKANHADALFGLGKVKEAQGDMVMAMSKYCRAADLPDIQYDEVMYIVHTAEQTGELCK